MENGNDVDDDTDEDGGARQKVCNNPADNPCFIIGGNPKKSIKQRQVAV